MPFHWVLVFFCFYVVRSLEKEDFFENLHILSRFVQLKSVLFNLCVLLFFQVLEPFLPDADQPFLREFFEVNMEYSLFGEWLEVSRGYSTCLVCTLLRQCWLNRDGRRQLHYVAESMNEWGSDSDSWTEVGVGWLCCPSIVWEPFRATSLFAARQGSRLQSSQLAEPLWTDTSPKRVEFMCASWPPL